MTIRQRISLLVVLVFLAVLGIGGFAISQLRQSTQQVAQVTGVSVPSVLASADLVAELKDVQIALMAYMSAPDAGVQEDAKNELDHARAQLQRAIDEQIKAAAGEKQRALTDQVSVSLQNYFSAIDDTLRFRQKGRNDLAQANLFANVAQYRVELEQIVDTLRIEKRRANDRAMADLNGRLATTMQTVSAVTLFCLLGLGLLVLPMYRQIVRPIARMQNMMREITHKQDYKRRLPIERHDEIGQSIEAFNTMLAKIEESSALLRQKNQDIQAILQNMPQGILTLGLHGRIQPEFSAYLVEILEDEHIASRSVVEVVFAHSDLGADVLSQQIAVIESCIGEDAMNFALNAHLLVTELRKTLPDGRSKVLELMWSPICDDSDRIAHLMLCIRDVTELRHLAQEAREQRFELEIIGEILAVQQEKFHEFIIGSLQMLDAIEINIHRYPQGHADAVAEMFRHLHTVKGNARTYGLSHLTQVLHHAEQTYDQLRQQTPLVVWDADLLLRELAQVRSVFERYMRINEVSLGRKGPGRRGSVERYLMVDRVKIVEALQRLDTVNTANLHDLLQVRDEVRHALRLLGTERLAEALASVIDALPSLAQELGKPAPKVLIEDAGYVLRSQAISMLKNVFMHLLRNAVDHGIERPEVRLALGKPAAGTISLIAQREAAGLCLSLSDDGRGLALERIRQSAIDKGLMNPAEVLWDEDVAAMIFHPGFSTASELSQISGRGVGMDAVQDLLHREKARLELVFTDRAQGQAFRQFALKIHVPESLIVALHEPLPEPALKQTAGDLEQAALL